MVKLLCKKDNEAIEQAIAQAEQRTRAEIVVAVIHSSDNYLDFILLYGLLFVDFLSLGLWVSKINTHFLELLALQLGILLSLFFIPVLRHLFWRLVPKCILHQRSARRALEEHHIVHRQLPATAPLVLLFISIGEHYTHILSSHVVYDKIPDKHWNTVIDGFAKTMSSGGLATACIFAIEQIGDILTQHFPENGESHVFSNQVIERDY